MIIESSLSGHKMSTMPFKIAEYFISFANSTGSLITNLKLQKLVYYTQAWHIAVFKNHIFEDDFQAWIHGPVLPALYDQYKALQWRPILRDDLGEETFTASENEFPESIKSILSDVLEEYFPMDAYALEKCTHDEQPWIIARKGLSSDEPSTAIIKKEDMYNYYSQFVKK